MAATLSATTTAAAPTRWVTVTGCSPCRRPMRGNDAVRACEGGQRAPFMSQRMAGPRIATAAEAATMTHVRREAPWHNSVTKQASATNENGSVVKVWYGSVALPTDTRASDWQVSITTVSARPGGATAATTSTRPPRALTARRAACAPRTCRSSRSTSAKNIPCTTANAATIRPTDRQRMSVRVNRQTREANPGRHEGAGDDAGIRRERALLPPSTLVRARLDANEDLLPIAGWIGLPHDAARPCRARLFMHLQPVAVNGRLGSANRAVPCGPTTLIVPEMRRVVPMASTTFDTASRVAFVTALGMGTGGAGRRLRDRRRLDRAERHAAATYGVAPSGADTART